MTLRWHIVTGEYPPLPGGVSDYTFILAGLLADAGDEVHVWTSKAPQRKLNSKIILHELPGHFGLRALWRLHRALNRDAQPFRLLVQYVPQMYGFKGMNLPFAFWLSRQRHLKPWIMFHEVAMRPAAHLSLKHRLLAHAQQAMARWIVRSMSRGFVSTQAWQGYLQDIAPENSACEWLPVPSNVATNADREIVAQLRQLFAPGSATRLVAHFGTYGGTTADDVARIFVRLLQQFPDFNVLLLGKGSNDFAAKLRGLHPALGGRIHSAGYLPSDQLAAHLLAADVLFQPYADGVSTRRGSAMAGLALGLPIVTSAGAATEALWSDEKLVVVVDPLDELRILHALDIWSQPSTERNAQMARAKNGYERFFGWHNTIAHLQECAAPSRCSQPGIQASSGPITCL